MKSILILACVLSLCASAIAILSTSDRNTIQKAIKELNAPSPKNPSGLLKDIGSKCSQADLEVYKLTPTCTERYNNASKCVADKGMSSCRAEIFAVREAGRAMLGEITPPPRPRASGIPPLPSLK